MNCNGGCLSVLQARATHSAKFM